jgi:hypothetical protein
MDNNPEAEDSPLSLKKKNEYQVRQTGPTFSGQLETPNVWGMHVIYVLLPEFGENCLPTFCTQ